MAILDHNSHQGKTAAADGPGAESAVPAFISTQVTRAQRFYLDLQPRSRRGLTVICGGREECAADYLIDRRDFPFLSLEFVASGRGELRLGETEYKLRPGVLFVYGPGWRQHISTDPHQRLVKYFIDFAGDKGTALLRECTLLPGRVVQLASIADTRLALDRMIASGSKPGRYTARACALQLELFLLSVASDASSMDSQDGHRAWTTYERCRARMDATFQTLQTVEQLADECHLDVAYLCRLFRRFAAVTPYQYLQRLKMIWAAERLRDTHLLVREVADELGLDAFQFSRRFKRVHGLSPSAFLQMCGSD